MHLRRFLPPHPERDGRPEMPRVAVKPRILKGRRYPLRPIEHRRVLQRGLLSAGRPGAPHSLLSSLLTQPDGHQMAPGQDLALSQAPEPTASPCCTRAPESFPAGNLQPSSLGRHSGETGRLGGTPGSFRSKEDTSLRPERAHTWRLRPAVSRPEVILAGRGGASQGGGGSCSAGHLDRQAPEPHGQMARVMGTARKWTGETAHWVWDWRL